jgi:hypothetical protein
MHIQAGTPLLLYVHGPAPCLHVDTHASERETDGGCGWNTTLVPCVLASQWHGGRGATHHCWSHPGQLVCRALRHRRFDDLRHADPPPAVCRGLAPFSSPPLPPSGIWACLGNLHLWAGRLRSRWYRSRCQPQRRESHRLSDFPRTASCGSIAFTAKRCAMTAGLRDPPPGRFPTRRIRPRIRSWHARRSASASSSGSPLRFCPQAVCRMPCVEGQEASAVIATAQNNLLPAPGVPHELLLRLVLVRPSAASLSRQSVAVDCLGRLPARCVLGHRKSTTQCTRGGLLVRLCSAPVGCPRYRRGWRDARPASDSCNPASGEASDWLRGRHNLPSHRRLRPHPQQRRPAGPGRGAVPAVE